MNSQKVCLHARIMNKYDYNQGNIENTLCKVFNANSMPRTEKLMMVVVNARLNI